MSLELCAHWLQGIPLAASSSSVADIVPLRSTSTASLGVGKNQEKNLSCVSTLDGFTLYRRDFELPWLVHPEQTSGMQTTLHKLQVDVRPSTIPGAGQGVFAVTDIPAHVAFEYKGKVRMFDWTQDILVRLQRQCGMPQRKGGVQTRTQTHVSFLHTYETKEVQEADLDKELEKELETELGKHDDPEEKVYTWALGPFHPFYGHQIHHQASWVQFLPFEKRALYLKSLRDWGGIDGEHAGNWTRYVNCCVPSTHEANLFVFQKFHRLFYYTRTTIPAGSELFVSYGPTLCRQLNHLH